jgi:hypothetical protein
MKGHFILTFKNEQEYTRWVNLLGFPSNLGRERYPIERGGVTYTLQTMEMEIPCKDIDRLQHERELENRGH